MPQGGGDPQEHPICETNECLAMNELNGPEQLTVKVFWDGYF